VQIVFSSPENLLNNEKFLLTSKCKENLVALAIDEAHFVKHIEYDIRTLYSILDIGDEFEWHFLR